ncbi:calcium-binding protein [Nocardioides sp. MH1]|uniref:calcium-binding protein n=1 Tax=Nocardioides sp. MH1 TaxID=3242490 RepID=UPI003522BFE5
MTPRTALALAAALVAVPVAVAGANGGPAVADDVPPDGPGTAGPPYHYATALMGQYSLVPLPDQAMITRTRHGYVYRAGQQDSHLTITLTADGLEYADTGTERFKRLPRACRRLEADAGVAAVCRVPAWVGVDQPLLVEVWPRLGDDYVDGSTLPESVAMTVLADAGDDVALLGAGPDFFNGFTGRDQVWGGGGDDWVRTGPDADLVWGGDGADQLVGTDGKDTFYGEGGDDRVGGGAGDDRLDGGPGADRVLCEGGRDTVTTDGADRLRSCESLIPG